MMKTIPNWISYHHEFFQISPIDIYSSRAKNGRLENLAGGACLSVAMPQRGLP
jgi:hypothetical protein